MEKDQDKEKEVKFMKQRIKELESAVYLLKQEKEMMIDNFQNSTNILIERIKSLEEQIHGQRPQTAQIMDNVGQGESKDILENDEMKNDSFIFKRQVSRAEMVLCYNCQKWFHKDKMRKHTIMCYRSIVKCKKCGEYVSKSVSLEHIREWTDPGKLRLFAMENDIDNLEKCLKHGVNVNFQFDDLYSYGLLHFYVENGFDGLIELLKEDGYREKVNLNIQDVDGNTPFMLALNKGDIEKFDSMATLGPFDVNLKNNNGESPLIHYIKNKDLEGAKKLLGMTKQLKDDEGEIIPLAQKMGLMSLVTLIMEKGGKLKPVKDSKMMRKPPKPNSKPPKVP